MEESVLPASVSSTLPRRVMRRFQANHVNQHCRFNEIRSIHANSRTKWAGDFHSTNRTVIFLCGGTAGTNDRIRGLTSLFSLAVDGGYDFEMQVASPVQWVPDMLKIQEGLFVYSDRRWDKQVLEEALHVACSGPPWIPCKKKSFNLCKWTKHRTVTVRTNMVVRPNAEQCAKTPIASLLAALDSDNRAAGSQGCLFWYLFRIGREVEAGLLEELARFRKWQKWENRETNKVIAIHVRTDDEAMKRANTMLNSSSDHDRMQSSSENDPMEMLTLALKTADRLARNNNWDKPTLLLAADREDVKDEALRRRAGVYPTHARPFHLGFSECAGSACLNGTVAVMVDLFMLALADGLVTAKKSKGWGASGFSKLAREIGMYPGEAILHVAQIAAELQHQKRSGRKRGRQRKKHGRTREQNA
eukprot:1146814-Rhodomonas_salina.1